MISKKKTILISFILFSITNISNSNSIEPDVFIQSTVNRASQVLSDNLTIDKKIKELKSIAEETVDIEGIGMYTLGSYRKILSEDQKQQYKVLFKEYFLKTFSSRLAEYSNPEIQVNSKEKLNNNYTMVSSVLVATEQRPKITIDWRVYTKNPNNPKIRDLIIEGLSLARTQKEEFSSIIKSNDDNIEVLFTNLKEFVK
jgi:phospholipid transport system substrate-binding protein|tara:strand:+ start:206 stop:802 length:597 start_codon:yes stop_codon:yes gene_type:complete